MSITGPLASTIGQKNPYRYRGYRYDNETGFYYLNSRYYNPGWGRFINADDVVILQLTQGELLSHNLFAYCINNPVNMVDNNGYFAMRTSDIKKIANIILHAIPAYKSLNALKKAKKAGKFATGYLSLATEVFEVGVVKLVDRLGLKKAVRSVIVTFLVDSVLTLLNKDFGDVVVWALKKFFKTEKRKEKQFYFWGKKKTYEYIVFW